MGGWSEGGENSKPGEAEAQGLRTRHLMAPSESRELRCEGESPCKACEDGLPSWVEIIPASL